MGTILASTARNLASSNAICLRSMSYIRKFAAYCLGREKGFFIFFGLLIKHLPVFTLNVVGS